ncbi:hypothetical protein [Streptomyces sp. NPDC056600]|uniref:hypothetical protein n=1 Tax=Streptomyces sp. NPDC056600 TaxID=3345874 RepID=UPI0036A23087
MSPAPAARPASASPPAPAARLRTLVTLPFRRDTWRHLLYALLLPLVAVLVVAPQPLMRAADDGGRPALGLLVLLAALLVAGAAGPAFERLRLRLFFGEHLGPRRTGRVRGAVLLLLVDLVLATLSFAAAAGWVVVSVRNLTYPLWGWEPYPTDAWGGPHPAGAVALHFAAGVLAFFLLPWVVVRVTGRQRAAVRRFAADPGPGPDAEG